MQTKSNKVNGVSWQVHTETGFDVLKKRQLLAKVYDPNEGQDSAEFNAWYEFIEAFVQSDEVNVGFEWPSYTSDINKLLPVRDYWLALPGNVFRAWKDDINEVNSVPGAEQDLLPPEMLPSEKKETPQSQESEPSLEPA